MIDANGKIGIEPAHRRFRAARMWLLVLALIGVHLVLAPPAPAEPSPDSKKDPDTVSITADQMHQISIVDAASCAFDVQKSSPSAKSPSTKMRARWC
jgi:hypothetical protein